MDAKKTFKTFLNELKNEFPTTEFATYKDEDVAKFEELITPNILKVLQRDSSLFNDELVIFGVNVSPLYQRNPELFWKNIQACSIAAFLSGDIKEKLGSILETVKGLWGGAGHSTDEIDKLIGNEETQSKVSDLLEFVMSTRIAKVVMSMMDSVDVSELGIDFENPEDVINMFKNIHGNTAVADIMKKMKGIIEEKLKRGDFTKEMIMQDIESIKARVQSAFGDMFNDMLGARQAEVPAEVFMGNSPEARRARMMARLKRKVNERKNAL
jgi:hypothetical protein